MKVLLASVGSRGDVQPMAVLGAALVRHGHDVTLAAPPDAAALAASFGLTFVPCGRDVTRWLAQHRVEHMGVRALLRELVGFMREELTAQAPVLREAGRGADVVVTAGLQVLGAMTAELCGATAAYCYYFPNLAPSDEHAPAILASWRGPRLAHRALHRLTLSIFARAILPPLNAARVDQGLAPLPRLVDTLPRHFLLAWDQAISRGPDDIEACFARLGHEAQAYQVGALQPPPAPLPDDVERFLDLGPCAFVGFGSMPDADRAATLAVLADAARLSGVRVVTQGPEPGRRGDVLVAPSLSHAALFPRVVAIAHHCGAGTTAAAARSGVPQIAVPHFVDQPVWAKRLAERGVSAGTLSRKRLRAAELAAAIRRCTDDAELVARARSLANDLTATDPVAVAVGIVTGLAQGQASSASSSASPSSSSSSSSSLPSLS